MKIFNISIINYFIISLLINFIFSMFNIESIFIRTLSIIIITIIYLIIKNYDLIIEKIKRDIRIALLFNELEESNMEIEEKLEYIFKVISEENNKD